MCFRHPRLREGGVRQEWAGVKEEEADEHKREE